MNDFLHDPITDQDDDFMLTGHGLSFELCPSCLTVRDPSDLGGVPLARIPLNLDHILGVAGGERIVAHTAHHHTLTVEAQRGALLVRVSTPHQELARYRVLLPARDHHRGLAALAAAAH